jgi:peptidyl-prolyl cis-trans isomerase A (cyclophilin A)
LFVKALITLFALGTAMFAQTPAPPASLMNPAALKAKAPETYSVKFTTSSGDFTVEVTRAWSPRGADRFYNLSKNHFFDGAAFFRYMPNFIVQWGIPANPKVAAVWQNANIPDDPKKVSNTAGTVTFATAGPNTRTTQIFINLKDNPGLDSQGFTPFGKVTEGMDVVKKLYSGYGETPDQGRIQAQGKTYLEKSFPKLDTIKSTTVTAAPGAAPEAAPAEAPAKAPAKKAAPPAKK